MSVFEHIQHAMEEHGFTALMYAWIGTALLICWCYVIPIGITEIKKRIQEKIETEQTEKEITEIQKRLLRKEDK